MARKQAGDVGKFREDLAVPITCSLCDQHKPLIKAHIIPKQFCLRLREGHPNLIKFSLDGGEGAKTFIQNGMHERLLCADCDNKLGQYDQYAYEVLPDEFDPTKRKPFGRRAEVYEIGVINVERFTLFLAALAWRASLSSDPAFNLVDLGPYENRIKLLLRGQSDDWLKSIGAVIVLFVPPDYSRILWSPYRTKFDDVNVIVFYLPPWKLLLKIDRRPFRAPFDKFVLRPNQSAHAYVQDHFSIAEFKLLQRAQLQIKAQES